MAAVELGWRSGLTEREAAEVRALVAAATAVDRTPPVSEAVRLILRRGDESGHDAGEHTREDTGGQSGGDDSGHPGGHDPGDSGGGTGGEHLLARAGGARVVGYAHVDGGTAELVVHPDRRRRGVGGRLVEALVARATAEHRPLRVWAHGEHPGARRLAEKYGFRPVRTLWRMRRGLREPPLAQPRWPGGVRLRAFRPGHDEAAFVEVNNRAFAWHPEQGHWDVEQVRLREREPWFEADGFLLAVVDTEHGEDAENRENGENGENRDRILGYHWTKRHSPELGEVYVLGVDPDQHGRGLGSALTLAGLIHLREAGMTTVMLYTEADNEAAIRTYRKLGFELWDADVAYELSPSAVTPPG